MGTGYTRNDTSNNIADGNIINAADLDGEFDAIESAMGTGGHTHDGTSAEGGPVTVLGPVQDFVASATEIKPKTTNTLDIGTSGLLFKDMFLDGIATIGSIKIDNAGTIGSASDGDAIAISSGGVVSFSQNTIGKTGSGYVLALQTSDTTIEATNVLGKIEFSAPDEASGTDAILVGASIEALAEATFDSATNSTALVFKTNTTGAATERMRLTSAGDLHFLDNRKAIFGAGSDLQIYHDGSHSYVSDQGTGNLRLLAANFQVNTSGNDGTYIRAGNASDVELFYGGTGGTVKLATTSTGIDVTGTVTADGLTSSGDLSITGVATIGADAGGEANVLTLKGRTSDNDGYIKYTSSDGATSYAYAGVPSANTLAFYTNGFTKRLEIGSGGDISFYEDTGTTAKFFWDASAESLGIGTSSPSSNIDIEDAAEVRIDLNSTAGRIYRLRSTTDSKFIIRDSSAAADRLTIDSSGNVGIGTSSPTTALDVLSGSASVGALQVKNASGASASLPILEAINGGGNTRLIVLNDGSVGIGTDSPTDKLNISSGSNQIGLDTGNQATYGTLDLGHFTNGAFIGTQAGTNAASNLLRFGTSGTERMRISSDGSCRWTPDGTTQDMTLDASGNLLVGTTNQQPASTSGVEGFSVYAGGQVQASKNGATAARFNRNSTDGTIIDLRKDGATVGSIGVDTSDLTIGTGAAGIRFLDGDPSLAPHNISTNSANDNAIDIGRSSRRFKDLYLSGGIVGNSNSITISTDNGTTDHVTVDTSGNLVVGKTTAGDTGAGVTIQGVGKISAVRNGGISAKFVRETSDGSIVEFVKDTATVGSIGNSGGSMYISAASTGGLKYTYLNGTNAVTQPCNTTGTTTNGTHDLGTSGARFRDLYLSGGVVFDAVAGNATSNTLDDYEEGTWTPVSFNATSATYSHQSGSYVKVGGLVFIRGRMTLTSLGDGSATRIGGLPFTQSDEATINVSKLINCADTFYYFGLRVAGTTLYGHIQDGLDSTMTTNVSFLGNSTEIQFSGTYQTDA